MDGKRYDEVKSLITPFGFDASDIMDAFEHSKTENLVFLKNGIVSDNNEPTYVYIPYSAISRIELELYKKGVFSNKDAYLVIAKMDIKDDDIMSRFIEDPEEGESKKDYEDMMLETIRSEKEFVLFESLMPEEIPALKDLLRKNYVSVREIQSQKKQDNPLVFILKIASIPFFTIGLAFRKDIKSNKIMGSSFRQRLNLLFLGYFMLCVWLALLFLALWIVFIWYSDIISEMLKYCFFFFFYISAAVIIILLLLFKIENFISMRKKKF